MTICLQLYMQFDSIIDSTSERSMRLR